MFKSHRLILKLRLYAIFRACQGVLPVKIVKDPGEKRQRSGKVHMNVQKGFHRPVQPVDQGNGSGNGTYGKRWVPVPDDQKASCKIDQQRTDLCKDPHDDHKPFSTAGFFQGQIGNFFIQSHKPAVFFLLTGKKFYQHGSAD